MKLQHCTYSHCRARVCSAGETRHYGDDTCPGKIARTVGSRRYIYKRRACKKGQTRTRTARVSVRHDGAMPTAAAGVRSSRDGARVGGGGTTG